MEIRPEEIVRVKERPIDLFYQGIKAQATKKDYTNKLKKMLCEFLKPILKGDPNLVVKNSSEKTYGKKRQYSDIDFEVRANEFVRRAKADPDWAESVLLKVSEKLKERTQLKKSNPNYLGTNSMQNYFKTVQKLFDMNGVNVSWQRIKSTYPENEGKDDTTEYTHKQIQKILDHSRINDKILILLYASSGIRAGAFDFRWKHIVPVYQHENKYLWEYQDITESVSKNGVIVCAMIKIYAGSDSEYLAFMTPECWNGVEAYRDLWIKETGKEPKPDDPFFKQQGMLVMPLGYSGIRKRLERLLKESGLRTPLPRDRRRYKIPPFNGFRRFFNKQNKKALSKNGVLASLILKESHMGHTGLIKLDKNYFKEHIAELIDEYIPAIPNLTISDAARKEADNIKLRKRNQDLENKDNEIEGLKQKTLELEDNIDKMHDIIMDLQGQSET